MAVAQRKRSKKTHTLVLKLDDEDNDAIMQAFAFRSRHALPDGEGNPFGRVIAEVCRGWLDMMGEWEWPCDQGGQPCREVKERGGKACVLKTIRKGTQAKAAVTERPC